MPRESGERGDHEALCRRSVELPAGGSTDHDGLEAAEAELRIAVGPVDRPSKAVELESQRGFVDPRRRRELRTEDSDADAPKAAQRTEPVPVALRQLDRGVPVRADAQLLRGQPPAALAGDEDHRDPFEAARPSLEKVLRRARLHAAHIDAADTHTVGDPFRRAGENEAEGGAGHRQDQEPERAALDAHARRSLPLAPSARGNGP